MILPRGCRRISSNAIEKIRPNTFFRQKLHSPFCKKKFSKTDPPMLLTTSVAKRRPFRELMIYFDATSQIAWPNFSLTGSKIKRIAMMKLLNGSLLCETQSSTSTLYS
tara:strand:- start:232729 stop:233052 length:324 start_codon:yes stop_codon:yes gene_type:complete